MPEVRREDHTFEEVQEVVIIQMAPDEASVLLAYLGHIQFEKQREYLNDKVVDLLEVLHDLLTKAVPPASITVRKPATPPTTTEQAAKQGTRQAAQHTPGTPDSAKIFE